MKKFSKLISILVALFLMISFAGCGNQQAKNDTIPSASSPASDDSNLPSGNTGKEPVNIVFSAWGDATFKESMEATIKNFEQKYDWIKVTPLVIPNADYDTKITTMVAAGEQLDLSMLESATIAYSLAEQGKLVNLKTLIDEDPTVTLESYAPVVYYYLDKGKIVGLGEGVQNFVLYYNKDLFNEAGIEPPPSDPAKAWEWDEFVNVAKKLTKDVNGKNASEAGFDSENIVQYGVTFPKWWGMWGNFVYANGGDYITDDGKFGLSQPEAAEAIQRLADLSNVHHVAPTTVAEKGMPGADIALLTNKVAMVMEGQWMSLPIANSGVNFDVGVLPKMKELKTQVVCGMYGIFNTSASTEASWELLKYFTNPAEDINIYKNGQLMPGMMDWLTKPELLDQWTKDTPARPEGFKQAVIGMALNHGVPTPTGTVKNFNKIMDFVNPALDKVWLGEMTAMEALKSIEEDVQAVVQGKRQRD